MKNEDFKFRVFVTLARLHSFTKTAEELSVSQPAVSQNISELERYYGVTLVTRDRNGVFLTDEGMDFLPYARNIIEAYSSAASFALRRSQLSALPHSESGNSRTDVNSAPPTDILPNVAGGGMNAIDGKSVAKTLISGVVPGVRLLDSELADKLSDFLDSEVDS